jgi:hypothetical protein
MVGAVALLRRHLSVIVMTGDAGVCGPDVRENDAGCHGERLAKDAGSGSKRK